MLDINLIGGLATHHTLAPRARRHRDLSMRFRAKEG
jgi:hypothetical protein